MRREATKGASRPSGEEDDPGKTTKKSSSGVEPGLLGMPRLPVHPTIAKLERTLNDSKASNLKITTDI